MYLSTMATILAWWTVHYSVKGLNPGVISKVGWVWSSRWTYSWIGLFLLTVTDVLTTWVVVIFRVKNISHCQQKQSYSGLHSPRRSNSTYFWVHYSLNHVITSLWRIRLPTRVATATKITCPSWPLKSEWMMYKVMYQTVPKSLWFILLP